MDLFDAKALPITVAAGFMALLIFLPRPGRKNATEVSAERGRNSAYHPLLA